MWPFGLEVLRVIEDMDASANYYSNVNFATSAVPLGSAQFSPTIGSITVLDYSNFSLMESGLRTASVPYLLQSNAYWMHSDFLEMELKTDGDTHLTLGGNPESERYAFSALAKNVASVSPETHTSFRKFTFGPKSWKRITFISSYFSSQHHCFDMTKIISVQCYNLI